MPKILKIAAVLLSTGMVFIAAGTGHRPAALAEPRRVPGPSPDFRAVPLYFVANNGQLDPEAKFYARASRYTLWLTDSGLVFEAGPEVSRLVFQGARKHPLIEASEKDAYRIHCFTGRDQAKWRADMPTFRTVLYRDLYDEIDLQVRGSEGEIEYDWIVRPGGDAAGIRFVYEGTARTRIDETGDLRVETSRGGFVHRRPDIRQSIDGREVRVSGGFRCLGDGVFGFTVGPHDPSRDLVIDPVVLAYSSYLGGSGREYGKGISIDSRGAIYVVGYTNSANFPKKNSFDPSPNGDYDAYLTKFNPGGKTLAYSTYFGGAEDDFGDGIAVDRDGNAIIVGETGSPDFPVFNALDRIRNGPSDAFVAKFSATGKSLVFSSLLGGAKDEAAKDVVVDGGGDIYVCGFTASADFPVKNAWDATYNGGRRDAFLCKIASSGLSLSYSTFLGGSDEDYAYVVAVDGTGAAYLTGHVDSLDFPVKNPFRARPGGRGDAFASKISASGKTLVYSSYLGGNGPEWGYGIAVDKDGNAYIAGETESSDFPVKKAFDGSYNGGDGDAFLTKVAAAGNSLAFSTFLGGSREDIANDVYLDAPGRIYLAGNTESANFPVLRAWDRTWNGDEDIFVTAFLPAGTGLDYSTYLGGKGFDNATDLAVDSAGDAFVFGRTSSPDFPVPAGFDKTLGGAADAVVIILSRSGTARSPAIRRGTGSAKGRG